MVEKLRGTPPHTMASCGPSALGISNLSFGGWNTLTLLGTKVAKITSWITFKHLDNAKKNA